MKIQYTNDAISKQRRKPEKIQSKLDEFMTRSETYMSLTYEERDGYKNLNSMYASWKNAVRRSGYAIACWKDGDTIWFEKLAKT